MESNSALGTRKKCAVCGHEFLVNRRAYPWHGDVCYACHRASLKKKPLVWFQRYERKPVIRANRRTGVGPFCKSCRFYASDSDLQTYSELACQCTYILATGHSRGTVVMDPKTKRKRVIYPEVCDKFERRRKS